MLYKSQLGISERKDKNFIPHEKFHLFPGARMKMPQPRDTNSVLNDAGGMLHKDGGVSKNTTRQKQNN